MPVARKTVPAKAAPAKAAPAKRTTAAKEKVAPAATKATPARASRRTAAVVEDDEPDLLAAMNDTSSKQTATDDDEDFDLLSDLTEEEGESWMPWDDEDQPEGIQGKVVSIGEVEREARFGGGAAVFIQVQDRSDPELVWNVRGYATVLANQLEREIEKGLSVGDTIAIKYFGEKENKKGDNSYKNFATVSKRK
jgi:hypothetical protein